MQQNKPIFIVIDGIDGCGKSTQAKLLEEFFANRGIKVILTKEPGGTEVGSILRQILISKDYHIENTTELLLYAADRLEHQKKVVIPKLLEGYNVISDRFLSSTYAYQIFGRKLDKKILDDLTKITVNKFPDFTFILDINPELALERAIKRLESENKINREGKFESLDISFFENVRKGFIWYSENFNNCYLIDANKEIDEIHRQIVKKIGL